MNQDNDLSAVLVTGASGYIAMHCILQLLQQGYRVRGTLRTPAREAGLHRAFAAHGEAGDRLEFITADLTSDDGWPAAVRDCNYVLHVASPNPPREPDDENALVGPARDGTLRLLRAAREAGVQRVVMTSSVAAVHAGHNADRPFTEADWSNTDVTIGAYSRSKTLAERAAWEYVRGLPEEGPLELSVINPSYVIGPILDADMPASIEIVGILLRREVPGCVRLGFNLVDVRDVAAAHLLAMTSPEAAGKRFICTAGFYWTQEIALVLERHFAGLGYRIPTRVLPDFTLRLVALFDGRIRRVVPDLGKQIELSSDLLRSTLDWQPRPIDVSIVDTAESLITYAS